ncbi:MAG: hypothetical protein AAGA08_14820 [Pseudomonadota bacterium]
MGNVSESDWELLNAFHDGELSDDDAAELERRLATDADLADGLEKIMGMSNSLKALRPSTVEPLPQAKRPRSALHWGGGLAAAVAAFAFVVWSMQPGAPVLLELHQALQQERFTVSAQDVQNVALTQQLGVHDLTAANLAPVSTQVIAHGQLAHYAGLNGCRLSYFSVDRALELPSGKDVQAISWTTSDGAHHAIIATGMDLAKFDAIATYLQHITHDMARTEVYASLTNATESAAPCVG